MMNKHAAVSAVSMRVRPRLTGLSRLKRSRQVCGHWQWNSIILSAQPLGRRVLCFCPALMLVSVPAAAETLADVIAEACRGNPAVEASRASSRAAQERVGQAHAQFGPTLNADASYGYASRRVRQNGATVLRQDGFTPVLSLTLDQPLFTFGRLTAQRRLAAADYGSSVADLQAAEQDLMANIIIAYASVLRDEKLVAIARSNLAQLTAQLDQIDARYAARYATETDLQQTRTRIFSGQAQLDLAQGALLSSRNRFRNVVGRYPENLAPLPQLPPLPRTLEEAQTQGVQSSPLLQSARYDLVAAQARLGQARSNTRPYVSLQGSLARTPLTIENGDPGEVTLQVQAGLTIPFYSSGLLSSRVREAAQIADSANQQLQQAIRDVREDIATYWDQLAATRRALPAYARAVSSADLAFQGAQQQQLGGQITSLDLLDTARDLLNSQQAQAQAEAQLYIQHAMLLGTMGQLRIETFAGEAAEFRPKAYTTPGWMGFPTGPAIEVLDAITYSDSFNPTPVTVEQSQEEGHEMPSEFERP